MSDYGLNILKEIMKHNTSESNKNIISGIANTDPELANSIKKSLFLFEDIVRIDDKKIQMLIKEINKLDSKLLIYALKISTTELKEHIFKNMSTRMSTSLKEDISLLTNVKKSECEQAQQKILDIIDDLELRGTIIKNVSDDFI